MNVPWNGLGGFGHVEEERVGSEVKKEWIKRRRKRDEDTPLSGSHFGLCFFDFFGYGGLF